MGFRQRLLLVLLSLLAIIGAACSAEPSIPAIAPPSDVDDSPALDETLSSTASLPPSATSSVQSPSTPTPVLSPTLNPEPRSDSGSALADIAFGYVRELSQTLGPRESGTDLERMAAEYLAAEFEQFGYSVQLQLFTVELLSTDRSSLTLDKPNFHSIEVVPLAESAADDASGALVPAGLGTNEDVHNVRLEGGIALIERGLITFEEKVTRARDAGAIGVVIYNNRQGSFRGALLNSSAIPVVAISQEEGKRLEQIASRSDVEVTISVVANRHSSQNVVAELRGPGEAIVVLGAHYDTVPTVPGANDNASGTSVPRGSGLAPSRERQR